MSKRESFEALKNVWMKEVDMYSTRKAAVKMVVGNKVDVKDREVTREEGISFARKLSTLFVECSAKTATGVAQTFEELTRKILQTPELCASENGSAGRVSPGATDAAGSSSYSDCAC